MQPNQSNYSKGQQGQQGLELWEGGLASLEKGRFGEKGCLKVLGRERTEKPPYLQGSYKIRLFTAVQGQEDERHQVEAGQKEKKSFLTGIRTGCPERSCSLHPLSWELFRTGLGEHGSCNAGWLHSKRMASSPPGVPLNSCHSVILDTSTATGSSTAALGPTNCMRHTQKILFRKSHGSEGILAVSKALKWQAAVAQTAGPHIRWVWEQIYPEQWIGAGKLRKGQEEKHNFCSHILQLNKV